MKKPLIFLVEDDPEIRSLVRVYLEREGFRVETAESGTQLDRLILRHGEPDVLLLDLMLPGEDGLSICRRIRAASAMPVIMLTAKGEDIDRIIGLEIGADDYLGKPFNPRELLARIKALLRRLAGQAAKGKRFNLAGLLVDLDARRIEQDGQPVNLTSAEFDLLACFVTRPQRVLSRDQLIDWTRGRNFDPLDRTIDVQMSRLRKKLAETGRGDLIQTVRNAGYMLTAPVESV
jgi:two-component system OmpR family response regulator